MARYTEAKCKLCRRERQKLFLKGTRCYTVKCALERRKKAPGQHGAKRLRMSDYAIHLREKQKVKRYYGLIESQLKRFFELAFTMAGNTGENLLILLERRLDNVVYTLGFANSRAEARQLVSHGHIAVNNRKVTIPSYIVKQKDIIKPVNKYKSKKLILNNLNSQAERIMNPDWVKLVKKDPPEGIVERLPARDDVTIPVKEQLIVEFYTR